MKLQDFLKCKKVKCVDNGGLGYLTEGKEYEIKSIEYISVSDNDGDSVCVDTDWFEPVLNQAENPLQGMKPTPEFETEASEPVLADNSQINIQDIGTDILDTSAAIKDTPKFKVGDKVYAPSVGAKVYTLKDFGYGWVYPIRIDCDYDEDHEFTKEGQITAEGLPILFLATELNHSLLSQLYGIDFERPPLTGNELCRKLLDKGEKYIMAKDEHDTWRIICDYCDDWFTDVVSGKCLKNVTPVNSKGEPLTQAVLDE